jgi:hypothetical protein
LKIFIISIAGMALLAAFPAAAYDLPKDIPARKPGLWEMRMTGTIGPNQLKAIKRYCLDENADRALHELTIRRKELDVVYSDISCQPPKISVTGNVVTGEMACRSNSTTDSETAGQDFRWTMTFESDSEVVNEEHSVARDVLFPGENSTVERQRWIGECPAGQKPGDGLDLGFNYNSEAWPAESRPINIQESSKVVEKMLKEAFEINERLGPM